MNLDEIISYKSPKIRFTGRASIQTIILNTARNAYERDTCFRKSIW